MKKLLKSIFTVSLFTVFSMSSYGQTWNYLSTSLSEQYYHSAYCSYGGEFFMSAQKDGVTDFELLKWNANNEDWEVVSTSPFAINARHSNLIKYTNSKFVISVIEESTHKIFLYEYNAGTDTWSELISGTVNNTWNNSSVYDPPGLSVNPVNGEVAISYVSSSSPFGSYAPVVLKYDGTTLSYLGTGNPRAVLATGSTEWSNNISVTYTANGHAHVLWGGRNNAIGPFLATFDGTNWVDRVGVPGHAGRNYYNEIITNSNDEVFVTFGDATNGATFVLKTTDFTSWDTISQYNGTSDRNSLTPLSNGQLYHRYNSSGYKIDGSTVTNFTGTSSAGLHRARMFEIPNGEYLLFGFDSQVYGNTRTYHYEITPAAATVTTQAVSNIGGTTATGNGNITDLGAPNPTQFGVCWNTTGTPTTSDSKTTEGSASATGAFTSSMTGLSECQTYYVRAYATNTSGTVYGSEVSFTTIDVSDPVTPTLSDLTGACSVTATAPTTTDACAGTITGTTNDPLTYSAQGNYTITWTFDDGNGYSIDVDQNVIVNDAVDPVISCATGAIVEEGATGTYAVVGTEFDPTSTSDNCEVASVSNDFNNTSTLADADLPIGVNTIVWTVTDNAGNTSTCNVEVTVEEVLDDPVGMKEIEAKGIRIFPNPTSGILNLESSQNNIKKVTILDITGKQVVVKNEVKANEVFDLSSYANGVFIIKIELADEVITTQIVKK